MEQTTSHILRWACTWSCILILVCLLSSCGWKESQKVIAEAERIAETKLLVYDDTVALAEVIRKLDNPIGRLIHKNTLGKAYYYMGRNHSLFNNIAEAAKCYIEADRLRIDDPIYQGRVNSCMGFICSQNKNDSIALIFYKRASEHFKESYNEWRYAQSLLNLCEINIDLHNHVAADSLLRITQTYQLDSAFQARHYETKGLYFFEQQQYDSAVVYLNKGLNYWESEEDRDFCYLKLMQIYNRTHQTDIANYYAQRIVSTSKNPNYIANAYYCLMQDAKNNNNVELLSRYSHLRTDAQKILRHGMIKDAEATPLLEEYLQNPHPWRWVWISFPIIIALCILFATGIWIYRERYYSAHKQLDQFSTHIRTQEKNIIHQQSLLDFERGLTEIMDKYHSPRNYWRTYSMLKKDIAPWLRDWTDKLDMLPLSEQEKIFCSISLIYPNLSDIEIADYMCYAKGSIRVLKNRIFKKIGISSSEFSNFLHNLSNRK